MDTRRRAAIITAFLICLPVLLVGVWGYLWLQRRQEVLRCQSNMREVYGMIMSYALAHNGRLPDNWEDIATQPGVTVSLHSLICPASGGVAPRGPTTQSIVADIRAGGHVSYVYLGAGKTTKTSRPDTVLVYEAMPRHDGVTVLCADGHVEFIGRARATLLLQRIADTSVSATQPATRASMTDG